MTKELGYWGYNHVEAVNTTPVWINPEIKRWVVHAFGTEQQFYQHFSRIVTIDGRAKDQLPSHPSGGRSLTHNLKPTFEDPHTSFLCFEADVKGVLLTENGFNQHQADLSPRNRQEVMIHTNRNEAFGPQSLEGIIADKDNILEVRKRDILTPIPAAILRLDEVIFRGKKMPTSQLSQEVPIKPGELGLFVRLWPVTSTRVSDLFQWENLLRPPSPSELEENQINRSLIQSIHKSRRIWQAFESARVSNGLQPFFGNLSTPEVYSFIVNQYAQQLNQMLHLGLSPSTGEESNDNTLHHTSLHNWTPIGTAVEWAPITKIGALSRHNEVSHLRKLANDTHAAVIALGSAMLSDYKQIPSLRKFLTQTSGSGYNSNHIKRLIDLHQPLGNGRVISFGGFNDSFRDWLIANQRSLT